MRNQSLRTQQSAPMASKQRGAAPIAVIIFLGMAAVILTVAFKIYPVIYEQWQVENVVHSFEDEKGLADLQVRDIEKRFNSRLITNNVRDFNFDESVLISMEDGLLSIEVEYESRVNIYKNIDAIVVFDDAVEVRY